MSIESDSPNNPIEASIKKVASLSSKNTLVDNFEEAELIIVDSAGKALSILKENEDATIALFLMPLHEDQGIRSLKRNYPERIVVCQLDDKHLQPGDKSLVPFMLTFGGDL
ncbi:MAG: hypothetical protein WC906_01110 [Parcubacteria group bacterium]